MSAVADRRGFTLLEVMISTIILSIGLVVLLTSFANCQRIMTASRDYETAQYVLSLGETVYPIPTPDLVTGDPFDDEQLNIEETSAEELLDASAVAFGRDRKMKKVCHAFSFPFPGSSRQNAFRAPLSRSIALNRAKANVEISAAFFYTFLNGKV